MARGKSSKTSKILAFHKEGLSVNEIADKLKLTYTGVYSAIRRSGAVVKKAKGEKSTEVKKQIASAPKATTKKEKKSRQTKTRKSRKSRSTLDTSTVPSSLSSSTGILTITADSSVTEAPNPLISVYTPLTQRGLANKLRDQLAYLNNRIVEVQKLIDAVEKA